jgi:hypothetical protein
MCGVCACLMYLQVLKWRLLPGGLTARLRCRSSAPPERDIHLDDIMAQTLTWLDVAIIFGPQVPLLVPLVLMAVVGQRCSLAVGLARLGKQEVGWHKSRPAVWSVALSLCCQQMLNVWVYAYGEMEVDGVGGVGAGTEEAVRGWTWLGAAVVGVGIMGAWMWQAWRVFQQRRRGTAAVELGAMDGREEEQEKESNRVPLLS